LIERQLIRALSDTKATDWNGSCDRTSHPTKGTTAPSRLLEAARKLQFELDGSAVTRCTMKRLDLQREELLAQREL
jgi:hypothetical protein